MTTASDSSEPLKEQLGRDPAQWAEMFTRALLSAELSRSSGPLIQAWFAEAINKGREEECADIVAWLQDVVADPYSMRLAARIQCFDHVRPKTESDPLAEALSTVDSSASGGHVIWTAAGHAKLIRAELKSRGFDIVPTDDLPF